ncbi:phenylalanine N-monooxygenase CYP79D16 [Nicotiana sylvestris]|uniref:phenylalanine N-monooxygenase CYP79D16 n=1 Tax=Nicotiana sylvestris TaxID=4096 RepID=UPI00388CBC26
MGLIGAPPPAEANSGRRRTAETARCSLRELILATVDNTSNAVEWTIREMLNQPKIMQMAIEEIDLVIGSSRLVQKYDLPQLNYVKACIKEAFRLHPISSFNVPYVSVFDTIVGEYFIPKGNVVQLSRIGLGRNPRVWEDTMKFKPERHVNEESREVVLTDSELRLLSFSIGRRGCPGMQLGSTITIMLIARLLQGFTWSLLPNSPGNDLVQNLKCDLSSPMPLFAQAKLRLSKGMYL